MNRTLSEDCLNSAEGAKILRMMQVCFFSETHFWERLKQKNGVSGNFVWLCGEIERTAYCTADFRVRGFCLLQG